MWIVIELRNCLLSDYIPTLETLSNSLSLPSQLQFHYLRDTVVKLVRKHTLHNHLDMSRLFIFHLQASFISSASPAK